MTPAGLTPGTHFRFVFVTDGTASATSTNIAFYDTFATNQAGGATYNGSTVTWQAIGSTSTVNAIDHIGQTNDAVYLADGSKVTTSTTTTGLWSGGLLHAINEDQNGTSITPAVIYTGTSSAGFSLHVWPTREQPGRGGILRINHNMGRSGTRITDRVSAHIRHLSRPRRPRCRPRAIILVDAGDRTRRHNGDWLVPPPPGSAAPGCRLASPAVSGRSRSLRTVTLIRERRSRSGGP
jgi:hypothetical protein